MMHGMKAVEPPAVTIESVSHFYGARRALDHQPRHAIDYVAEIKFNKRRAVQIENDSVRLTMTVEGGHVAEILHKKTAVNPLWVPPWPSIEPWSCPPVSSTRRRASSTSCVG